VTTKKLTRQLVETLAKLDGIIDQLRDQNVHVSFFHHRGNFGLYSDTVSDRITLGSVVKSDVLYDSKSKINNIEEKTDDNTTKA
jgi:hypothetical protein